MSVLEGIEIDVANLRVTLRVLTINFNDDAAAPIVNVILDQGAVAFRHRDIQNISESELIYDRAKLALEIIPTLPEAKELEGRNSMWLDLPKTRSALWDA